MRATPLVVRVVFAIWFRIIQRWQRWWYRNAFLLSTRYFCASAMIDKSNAFNAPVRCDGAATVRLGPQNVFGYDKAIRLPKVASGY